MHSTPQPSSSKRRGRRLAGVAAACATVGVLGAAAPGVAGASTVGFDASDSDVMRYIAASGEVNQLTTSRSPAGFLRFTDPGALIEHGPGCVAGPASHVVDCAISVTSVSADLGGGDDEFTNATDFPVTIDSGSGNDSLRGGPGNDELFGSSGNDRISGGAGADRLAGGLDTDTVDYSDRTGSLAISIDDVANDGDPGEGDDVRTDVENVNGGISNDHIVGSNAPNVLQGGGGDDELTGRLGADVLDGGTGGDEARYTDRAVPVSVSLDGVANDGQPGENDKLLDIQDLAGGSGSDSLTGNGGPNSLTGGPGNDVVKGLGADDFLVGGPGGDALSGGDGTHDTADYESAPLGVTISLDGLQNDGAAGEKDNVGSTVENVIGSSHDDTLVGSGAANRLRGEIGQDVVDGRGGNDQVEGGTGNDRLRGGTGDDKFAGGNGSDTVEYGDHAGVKATIGGKGGTGLEADAIAADVENLAGSEQADTLTGDAKANALNGLGGDDKLFGLGGVDALTGGLGADLLDGGLGSDKIDAVDVPARADDIVCGADAFDITKADTADPGCI